MRVFLEDHRVFAGSSRKPLIENLNLTLNGGACYCLVGASGIGKTSLLMSMTRRGALRGVDGQWRRATYASPRETVSAEHATVRQFLDLVSGIEQLANWRLAHVADQKVSSLSLGEKTRLSLAVAQSLDPDVLLLDEPNIGLDLEDHQRLTELIGRRSGLERITVASTHDLTAFDIEQCKILYMRRNEQECAVLTEIDRILVGEANLVIDGLGARRLSGSAISMARSLLKLQIEQFQ